MTVSDLDRIEATLGVRLPPEYRDTLLNYPLPVDADSSSLWLVDDASEVIATTQQFRARSEWSDNFLYLGSDGGEEAYFLDLDRTPASVVAYEHETGSMRPEASDLAAWIEELRQSYKEIEDDARLTEEQRGTKPWWVFWK